MHYRSIADLNTAVIRGLNRLPADLDLVVGIPRSGLLAANIVSLALNVPMTDLDGFLAGRVLASGGTKRTLAASRGVSFARNVLVVDDSIRTGDAMRKARAAIIAAGVTTKPAFAAIYGVSARHAETDFVFEVVPEPRMFQWNLMHHGFLGQSCVDIDGVLCADPTADENDDGEAYRRYLTAARPLHRPTRKIGYVVTSRLEKYRPLTEAWLAAQGIRYGKLVMLDLPSKLERQRRAAHGRFKADFYRDCDAVLFIESEHVQATEIASGAGKPVLCLETQEIIMPGSAAGWLRRRRSPAASPRVEAEASSREPLAYVAGYSERESEPIDIGYVIVEPADQVKPRTLISYLGPTADNAGEVVESVRKACAARGEFPVLVLSELRQDMMVSCKAPIEFLPEMKHVPALAGGDYAGYITRRWALMLEKWKIEREVALGLSLEEFLGGSGPAG